MNQNEFASLEGKQIFGCRPLTGNARLKSFFLDVVPYVKMMCVLGNLFTDVQRTLSLLANLEIVKINLGYLQQNWASYVESGFTFSQ